MLATLMAFLMLSISCVASACEVSCDLRILGPGCHSSARGGAESAIDGMHECNMAKNDGSTHAQAPDVCSHAICDQQPQVAGSDPAGLPAPPSAMEHRAIAEHSPRTLNINARIAVVDTSPSRALFLVALQTTFRV